jgi:hypothetical protein
MAYEPSKASRVRSIAAICLLLALPVGCMTGGPYTETYPRLFNSTRWKTADLNRGDEARCGMLADLKGRIGLVGKSRSELLQLLGQPEDHGREAHSSYWLLCNSFADVWVLRVQWQHDQVKSVVVHDT